MAYVVDRVWAQLTLVRNGYGYEVEGRALLKTAMGNKLILNGIVSGRHRLGNAQEAFELASPSDRHPQVPSANCTPEESHMRFDATK